MDLEHLNAPLPSPRELLRAAERSAGLRELGLRLLVSGQFAPWFAGDYYDPEFLITFGTRPEDDLAFSPSDETLMDVLGKLPPGWTPDLILFVFPEYTILPRDLERSPYPLAAIISDWNVGLRRLLPCLHPFDFLLTDANGTSLLRRLGFERTYYWPAYSFVEGVHRSGPVTQDIDISFIGNLSPWVQRERTRYLKRIADLAGRYRVDILDRVYGEDYVRVLQRSKIVFNRSIRGELNLRCYEAPACGGLLFLEDTNAEAPSLLRDRVDCVYYDDANLTELAEYYLGHDEERERIARSGHERVLESTYSAHFSGLLRMFGALLQQPGGERRVESSETAKLKALAHQSFLTNSSEALQNSERLLRRALELAEEKGPVLADLAVVFAKGAMQVTDAEQARGLREQALECFQAALACPYESPLLPLNAALFFQEQGWAPERFKGLLKDVLARPYRDFSGLLYGPSYDLVYMELESAFSRHALDTERQAAAMTDVVQWQAARRLAELSTDPSEKVAYLRKAVALRPDLAPTQSLLGQSLHEAMALDEAVGCFEAALEDHPFDHEAIKGLILTQFSRGEFDAALACCDDYLKALLAIPRYHGLRAELGGMRHQIQHALDAALEPPFQPDGLRSLNYLLVVEPGDADWGSILDRYIERHSPAEDVSLHIYGPSLAPASLLAGIESRLERLDLSAEEIPDVVLIENALTRYQENVLFTHMKGIFGRLAPERRERASALGVPVLSENATVFP